MTRKCPECSNRSTVIDTRETTTTVRRIRECIKCKARWSTWETASDPAQSAIRAMQSALTQLAGVQSRARNAANHCKLAMAGMRKRVVIDKRDSGQCPLPLVRNAGRGATGSRPDSRERARNGA